MSIFSKHQATFDRDKKLVQELLNLDRGLNEWELDFADSLGKWVYDKGRSLTDRQRGLAEAIIEGRNSQIEEDPWWDGPWLDKG